jgi:fructooligosaccharide transport system substrate-binding protein
VFLTVIKRIDPTLIDPTLLEDLMSKKRLFMVLSLLVIAVMFASCAAPTAAPTAAPQEAPTSAPAAVQPTTSTEVQATTPAETQATAPAAVENAFVSAADGYAGPALTKDKITLRVLRLSYSAPVEDLRKKQIKDFETAYPNITIEEDVVPFGELYRKIQTVVAAGDPPDILFYDGPNTKTYAFYSILQPIDAFLTDEFKKDYVPATAAELSYKGQLFGFPERQSAMALNYNCDMTKAAGINPPSEVSQAWTMDQALEAWKKLQQDPSGSGNPTVWGLAPSLYGPGGPGFYYRDGIWIRSNGDAKAAKDSSSYKTFAGISEDGTTVTGYLDSPEAIEGAQWFQDLTMKWKVSPKVGIPNSFLDGKAASDIRGENEGLQAVQAHPNGDFCFGSTPIPYFKTSMTTTGSTTAGITAQSKHAAEAAAYLISIYGDKGWLEYFKAGGFLPARLSLYNKIPELQKAPYLLFSQEVPAIGVPRPGIPGWVDYDAIASPAMKDIALGADVAATLHKAAADIDAQLAKYK